MNVFELHERLIGDYSSYIRSFIRIDRFGRRTPLNVYALLPSTDGFGRFLGFRPTLASGSGVCEPRERWIGASVHGSKGSG